MLCVMLAGCRKEGTGGAANVSLHVAHHGTPIPSAVIHIRYGAREFPGTDTSVYDARVVTGNTGHSAGHTHVKGLRPGDYYFYARGFDSTIRLPVTGGTGLHIARKEREQEFEVEIPVTE